MDQVFARGASSGSDARRKRRRRGLCLCELPERDEDRENLLVARSEHSFVLLNNYPYNPGHVMVIPANTPATTPS